MCGGPHGDLLIGGLWKNLRTRKSRALGSVVRGGRRRRRWRRWGGRRRRQPAARSGLRVTVFQLRRRRVGQSRLVDRRQVGRRLGVFYLRVSTAADAATGMAPLAGFRRLLFDERQHLAQLLERDLLNLTVAGGVRQGRQRDRVVRFPLVDDQRQPSAVGGYHPVPADRERRRRYLDVVRGRDGYSGGGGVPAEHRLGFLEAAAEPFPALAQHEKPRAVASDPVLFQTVPALWLPVLLLLLFEVLVRRSGPVQVQVLEVQLQFTGATTTVRLDRLDGHVAAAARGAVAVRVVQVRVDAARRPLAPACAVTARRSVQLGHGVLSAATGTRRRGHLVVGLQGRRRRRKRGRTAVPGVELRVPPIVANVLVRSDAQRGYVHVEHAQVQQQHHGDQGQHALGGRDGHEHVPVHRQPADAEQLVYLDGLIAAEHRLQVVFDAHRVRVVDDQLDQRHEHDHQAREHGRHDAHDERHVVPGADAVVQPLAVVVELLHALIARAAVLGPVPGREYVAQVTLAVFDDVRVLGLVQLGHGLPRRSPVVAELRVRGVDEQRGRVRHNVQEEQAAQHEQRDRVYVGPEAGQQDAERTGAERGQHQPAGHLLRVPGHLQPMDAPLFPPGLTVARCHDPRHIARFRGGGHNTDDSASGPTWYFLYKLTPPIVRAHNDGAVAAETAAAKTKDSGRTHGADVDGGGTIGTGEGDYIRETAEECAHRHHAGGVNPLPAAASRRID